MVEKLLVSLLVIGIAVAWIRKSFATPLTSPKTQAKYIIREQEQKIKLDLKGPSREWCPRCKKTGIPDVIVRKYLSYITCRSCGDVRGWQNAEYTFNLFSRHPENRRHLKDHR